MSRGSLGEMWLQDKPGLWIGDYFMALNFWFGMPSFIGDPVAKPRAGRDDKSLADGRLHRPESRIRRNFWRHPPLCDPDILSPHYHRRHDIYIASTASPPIGCPRLRIARTRKTSRTPYSPESYISRAEKNVKEVLQIVRIFLMKLLLESTW